MNHSLLNVVLCVCMDIFLCSVFSFLNLRMCEHIWVDGCFFAMYHMTLYMAIIILAALVPAVCS